MEASTKPVNPFSKYRGIRLNDQFIASNDLSQTKGKDQFESDVISFCREIFDNSESISIQTSGSTGAPKSLTFQKSALIQSASATNDCFSLDSRSKALLSLPLNYVAAKLMVVRAIIGEYNLATVTPTSNPLKELKEPISFIPMTPHQVKSVLTESPQAFDKVAIVLLGGGEVSIELRSQLPKLNAG
ncbi:MAG: O-succinylbenzoic acid--CoA ligase, partial [Sediminicola sp.]